MLKKTIQIKPTEQYLSINVLTNNSQNNNFFIFLQELIKNIILHLIFIKIKEFIIF